MYFTSNIPICSYPDSGGSFCERAKVKNLSNALCKWQIANIQLEKGSHSNLLIHIYVH